MFPGAPISCKERWTSIYEFSISNRLTDSGIQQLLDLIRRRCPMPNSCPPTIYKLKKQICQVDCIHFQYCSFCKNSMEKDEKKCGKCSKISRPPCYYAVLPFENHLKEVFVGKLYIYILCILCV